MCKIRCNDNHPAAFALVTCLCGGGNLTSKVGPQKYIPWKGRPHVVSEMAKWPSGPRHMSSRDLVGSVLPNNEHTLSHNENLVSCGLCFSSEVGRMLTAWRDMICNTIIMWTMVKISCFPLTYERRLRANGLRRLRANGLACQCRLACDVGVSRDR